MNINTTLNAQERGWGPGWPNCDTSRIVPLEYVSLAGGVVRFPGHRIEDGNFVEDVAIPAGVRPEIHDLVLLLLRESEIRGYINLRPGWCWGFACRPIKKSTGELTDVPSNHSWALALDLNAPENGFGASTHAIPDEMGKLWNRYGFRWGGDYSSTKDWMHFEFMGTPTDARAMLELAIADGIGGDELTPEQEKTLKDAAAFLDALRDGLRPGPDVATAAGAGYRVAKAVVTVEKSAP